jgi:pimeloyl-ACP methyl ester carboxylesterase
VTFDFLGFGASDKPSGATYSFKQQLGDLEAVVEGLALGKIVPVAHDSSGMATLNYALKHLPELETLDISVKLIWGQYDPYITVDVAERRQSQLKNASLTVIPAGHWLQADEPAEVAKAMLS